MVPAAIHVATLLCRNPFIVHFKDDAVMANKKAG